MLMEQNTMLILFLILFFYCGLLHCGESDKAYFNKALRTDHEHKARRNDNIIKYSNILNTSHGNETFTHDSPPSVPAPSSSFSYTSTLSTSTSQPTTLSKFPEDYEYIYPTFKTSQLGPKGTSTPPNVEAPYITVYVPGFGVDSLTLLTVATVDPSAAEYAKKWLQKIASSTAVTPKLLVPKLGHIFDYNYAADGFRRRNQKTIQRKISYRQLKNHTFRHQTRPIVRQGATTPQTSKRRPPKKLSLQKTKRTQTLTTVTKRRLKPDLLLGKATTVDDSNTEDDDDFKKITSGNDESKKILRMHVISEMAKKKLYSDQTAVQELTTTTFVRHLLFPIPNTTTETTETTTQSNFEMKEIHKETYMIGFLIELTRLIATKEKTAVHDVVKHAHQIIRGLYKSGQLHWFRQPLMNVTKKVAKLLKESEINVTQKRAADIHHMLRNRPQMLSMEVNTILEYADGLYDDDDGKRLLVVLNEFAVYPNITLTGYWLCNSLINNFLRPYRRITDKRQRQKLIDTVNLALEARLESSQCNETTVLQTSDVTQADVSPAERELPTPRAPQTETTRSTRKRKRKRKRRHHKRKRERTRLRLLNNSYVID